MRKTNQLSRPAAAGAIDWVDATIQRVNHGPETTIFAQGAPAVSVMYIEKGTAQLSVVSHAGKEAVIAVLEDGHFFGEGCLSGQTVRTATATAISECSVLRIRR